MIKQFFLKQMLKRQLAGLPEDQREQIIAVVEANPELFNKIGKEVQARVKGGESQQAAAMTVFRAHQSELQEAMKGLQK